MRTTTEILNISFARYLLLFILLWICECSSEENYGDFWEDEDDAFVRVRTVFPDLHFTVSPPEWEKDKFANTVIWIFALTAFFLTAIVIVCCFLFCKLARAHSISRNHSADPLVTHPPPIPATAMSNRGHTSQPLDPGLHYHSQHLDHLASVENQPSRRAYQSDVPPDYSVVMENVTGDEFRQSQANFPRVHKLKTMETPPPAYMNVAPFQ